jgi:transcriptional regulator with XRE-family HTH domain
VTSPVEQRVAMARTSRDDPAERDTSAGSLTPHQRLQLELGGRLRELRKSGQLTQIEMSRRLGVSQSTVSELETGRTTPNIVTLERIADVLELAPEVRTELTDQLAQLHAEISTWRVLYRRGHRWNQERIGGLEAQARVIRSYQMAVIPGLLQPPRDQIVDPGT